MASQMKATLDNVISKLLASANFDRVNKYEPKSPPGNGFEAAVIWGGSAPHAGGSGLATAAMVYIVIIRVYRNMLADPPETIDSDLLGIADDVLDDLGGDFDLGGTVRNVDIFGEAGTPLSTKTGYIDVGGTMYRALDITVPIIVNDVISEAA